METEILDVKREMFINLSPKNENFNSPREARIAVLPETLREKGLIVSYSCNDILLIDRFMGNSQSDYHNPYYWEAVLGTQNNGKITDLKYSPKLWETRKGSYFISEKEGTFENVNDQHGNKINSLQSGLKKFTASYDPSGNLYYTYEVDQYTGSEFQWASVNRGAIEHVRTFTENNETFAEIAVYPNTNCMGVANRMTLVQSGSSSQRHDRRIKEGTFKLKIGSSNMFTLAVDPSGNLLAFGSEGWDNRNILPPVTLPEDCLLIGFFGTAYPHINYLPIAPFSGEHVISNNFTRYVHSSNLSDLTFIDISDYAWGMKFKREALLNDKLESIPNTYYLTLFENPGTYKFDHIPLTVTTTKPKTVLAIRYSFENSLKWDAVEVPVSKIPEGRVKIDQFAIDPGVYVIIDRDIKCPDLVGREGTVKIACLGGITGFPTVNVKNIDFYNAFFHDFHGKNDFTIEGCTFSGHPAYYHGSLYFINTGYYKREILHNVIIRNCTFDLPQLYTTIWGEKLNTIEITGCNFNTKNIAHPIRINYCTNGALIRNNKVNNGVTGIFFGSSREKPISNCVVESNILMNQTEEGISFDGFGNNRYLCPVIGNGKILNAANDPNGRLVIKADLQFIPHDYKPNDPISSYKISDLDNWTDYYATFNKGTGIDGTLCHIHSFDVEAETLTLDIFTDASEITSGAGSFFGVQSGFFDCVIRNNIIKSDRFDYCTALSIYLNVFNMLIENNKVYRMNSFMNVAGGFMLGLYDTLAWGNKIINNTFTNCNSGSFYSYWSGEVRQYNNVFKGNILKNVKEILIQGQRNFEYKDNLFDNVGKAIIFNCESYIPEESELKTYHLGQVYNKFINDAARNLYDVEQKIVRRDATGNLILKNLI